MYKRVLYVEDKPDDLEFAALHVEMETGSTVEMVDSLIKAEESLKKDGFDVVIMDIRLDDKDDHVRWDHSGLVLIERIRKGEFMQNGTSSQTPIIVATAVSQSSVQGRGGKVQVVSDALEHLGIPDEHVVNKPWSPDGEGSLVEAVSKAISEIDGTEKVSSHK